MNTISLGLVPTQGFLPQLKLRGEMAVRLSHISPGAGARVADLAQWGLLPGQKPLGTLQKMRGTGQMHNDGKPCATEKTRQSEVCAHGQFEGQLKEIIP